MRKIIICFLILILFLFHIDGKAFMAKKIDLRLSSSSVGVVFLRLNGSNSLLINDEDSSNLFVLDYKNDVGLKETLHIFSSKPNVYFLNSFVDRKFDNIHVLKRGYIFKFRINNYSLCIYDDGMSLNGCDFVYLRSLSKDFVVPSSVSVIFYDDDILKKWLRNVQESWVDNYIVGTDSFTILKLNEESYNIMIIPSTKD